MLSRPFFQVFSSWPSPQMAWYGAFAWVSLLTTRCILALKTASVNTLFQCFQGNTGPGVNSVPLYIRDWRVSKFRYFLSEIPLWRGLQAVSAAENPHSGVIFSRFLILFLAFSSCLASPFLSFIHPFPAFSYCFPAEVPPFSPVCSPGYPLFLHHPF